MPSQSALQQTLPAAEPAQQSGAYAVIEDAEGRVLTVQADNGRTYLPGGRIEPGESPRDALVREIGEECGWTAAPFATLRNSSQTIMDGAVLLQASHWRARLIAPLASMPEHLPLWLTPEEALNRLHRDCDRAAIRTARSVSSSRG